MLGKRFLVIGVGRFGKSIVKELYAQGNEVVACDQEEHLLANIEPYVNHSIIGDATDINVLEEMNAKDFDSIVVSIGDNFEAAIMCVKNLKDMGCKNVLSKANDHKRGEVLAAVGADRVIFPEEETGTRVARQLANPGVLEYVQLAPNCSGMEMDVPESFYGKNLIDLDFRRKYGVTVVMISKKNTDFPIISPTPTTVFELGDIFFVVGENEDLEKLQKKIGKERKNN